MTNIYIFFYLVNNSYYYPPAMFVGDILKFVNLFILIGLVNNYILFDFKGKLGDTHNFIAASLQHTFILFTFHLKRITPLKPPPPPILPPWPNTSLPSLAPTYLSLCYISRLLYSFISFSFRYFIILLCVISGQIYKCLTFHLYLYNLSIYFVLISVACVLKGILRSMFGLLT